MNDYNKIKKFESEIERLQKQLRIPGISVAVTKNRDIIFTKGIGYSDLSVLRTAAPQTTYFISSITKTFASAIILKLAEENALDIDAPVFDFGIKIKSPGRITVRNLLSHTSGGMPGSQYDYSDRRFYLLEQVMLKASGCSFAGLLTDIIIKPLKLYSTIPCTMTDNPNFPGAFLRLAKPYVIDDETNMPKKTNYTSFFGANDGLISSVEDLSVFSNALDSNSIISQKTKEMAWANYISNDGRKLPYGLGWFVQLFEGRRFVWHHGWSRGFSSLILKATDENTCLVLLANNEELSRPFPLTDGDVTMSPFATAFIKAFVPKYDKLCDTFIDWSAGEEVLKRQLRDIAGSGEYNLLLNEIISQCLINLRFRQDNAVKKLCSLASDLFPDKNIKMLIKCL